MADNVRKVLILGSGPAGLTAALYAARARLSPILFHGPLAGGQLTTTTEVENFPGFRDGIMGMELIDQMTHQAARFGTEIVQATATKVDLSKRPFTVELEGRVERTEALIVATGASPRLLGLPREAEMMGHGLSTCATCDGAFCENQEIVVVGGGDSACEEALFLTKFGKRVRMIHRRDELRASKIMAERVLKNPKIVPCWNKTLVELKGDKKTGITGAVLQDTVTGEKSDIECHSIFYAIGHVPNSQLFVDQVKMDPNGYIITRPNSTVIDVEGVFVCGDVQDHVFRQAVTAAGSGCMAAIECERWLAAAGIE